MHSAYVTTIVAVIYLVAGGITVIAYVPQVIAALKDKHGAHAISLKAWLLWSATSLSTLAYSIVVIKTLPIKLVSSGNFIGCLAVFLAAAYSRITYARAAIVRPRQ